MPDPLVSPAAGFFVDKPFWDSQVYGQFADLYAPWTAYTPAWRAGAVAATIGNGTLAGKYKKIGKLLFWAFRFVWGSTTPVPTDAGIWFFGFPPGMPIVGDQAAPARCTSPNGNQLPLGVSQSGTDMWFTTPSDAGISRTVPYTWGGSTVGRTITASGFYETSA
ncbi:hypothetical protein [Nonomuraea sp. NPDC050786]|uniref:hypothetical protein n=1 Tax=Nonomuraea sp. NPDC050786 TaxID=3154840 RepID=UPI0033F78CCF